jgi:hypothetical protein
MSNTKQQGDVGVATAVAFYTHKGYIESQPLKQNTKYDLVVDKGGTLYRVQVKTSRFKATKSSYRVNLKTCGGNQSWDKIPKNILPEDCDLLFAYSFDGKCYEFPPEVFVDKPNLTLGASKQEYVVWEINSPE